jgi:hypothetical protein
LTRTVQARHQGCGGLHKHDCPAGTDLVERPREALETLILAHETPGTRRECGADHVVVALRRRHEHLRSCRRPDPCDGVDSVAARRDHVEQADVRILLDGGVNRLLRHCGRGDDVMSDAAK